MAMFMGKIVLLDEEPTKTIYVAAHDFQAFFDSISSYKVTRLLHEVGIRGSYT